MAMTETEFWNCTPHYFVTRINGMRAAKKVDLKERWEQTRLIMWASGEWKEGTQPKDIFRFPWEKSLMDEMKELESKWRWNKPNLPPPNA